MMAPETGIKSSLISMTLSIEGEAQTLSEWDEDKAVPGKLYFRCLTNDGLVSVVDYQGNTQDMSINEASVEA